MTSLQTRLARAASEAARRTWNRHRGRCDQCAGITREHPAGHQEPCAEGRPMLGAIETSRANARREAELDREAAKAHFGMEPLFTEGESS